MELNAEQQVALHRHLWRWTATVATVVGILGGLVGWAATEVQNATADVRATNAAHEAVAEITGRLATAETEAIRSVGALEAQVEGALVRAKEAKTRLEVAKGETDELRADLEGIRGELRESMDEVVDAIVEALKQPNSSLREEMLTAVRGAPIGAVLAWPQNELPDSGDWRRCDGEFIRNLGLEKAEVAVLESILGSRYLPDYRGYFLRGYGAVRRDGEPLPEYTSAANVGEHQDDQVGSHRHTGVLREAFNSDAQFEEIGTAHLFSAAGSERQATPEEAQQPVPPNRAPAKHHVDGLGDNTSRYTDWWPPRYGKREGDVPEPMAESRPVNRAVHWIIRVK